MTEFYNDVMDLLFSEGFVKVSWADACELPKKTQQYFDEWIDSAKYGTMTFLERPDYVDAYKNPLAKYPYAKSIISAVFPYNIFKSQNETFKIDQKFKVSRYALNVDYHKLINRKLQHVTDKLKLHYPGETFTFQVDSGALPEIYWAEQAGVGMRRKNGLLYVPDYGSYVFIALIITSIKIEAPKPPILHDDFCMHCNKCVQNCPTKAITSDYSINPRKCISYLTIEHKGEFSEKDELSGWVFGCDVCQQVCPKNSQVHVTDDKNFMPGQFWKEISVEKLHNMSKSKFKNIFRDSPIKRTGLKRFIRNIDANIQRFNDD